MYEDIENFVIVLIFNDSYILKQGWTALHWSVDQDHSDIVQLLVDKGCHLDIKGNVRNDKLFI
jgi:ankyrin repeat protein